MENVIVPFLNKYAINDPDAVDDMIACINQCFVHISKNILEVNSGHATKTAKLDSPSDAKSVDELRGCTTQVLNEFCKNNGLRVGGNKKDIMDRVWRYLQGTNSDDDKSPRSKPKKDSTASKKEKHMCCGKNSKGNQCASSASECVGDKWYCWRHISDANSGSEQSDEEPAPSTPEPAPAPVSPPKAKTPAAPKKKAAKKEILEEED